MGKNRKCSKIDRLPLKVKDAVEQMMLNPTITYREIASYIRSKGYEISISSVQRHAANLNESATALKMTQENFKVLMSEMEKYPNLDTTEAIVRLLSGYTLEAIGKLNEDSWDGLDPLKLMSQATALTRAAAYKAKIDIDTKDKLDIGFDYVKDTIFETMAEKNPKLYEQFKRFIEREEKQIKNNLRA